ncbi:amphiphysin isoform X3 [Xiphophorus hellerii]|uniref:amphiphysin isoform X3 n=1 Tax=Xiphophorus hellerii TaxID=8084 RepID=UPI0013B46A30|nr:amphiphysin isoform X3 [Xiphophorus hellerii]
MAEIKTGIFAKNVQKRLNRAQEKVLQKLGKADETKDEQFEQVVINFKRQESEGARLQREMKSYMSAIKGMQQASINLTQSLHEVYEPDWHGKDDIVTIGKDCDALWEDFHNKLVDSTLLNLDGYLQQFPDLKMRVAKRSRKLIDYDSARHQLEALQVPGMKNDRKVMKAEDELKKAQKVFDELNVGLQDELPTLWDRRVGFYISTFRCVTSLEAKFHREISLVCRELYEVMTKLGEQHSDKIFTIQGAPSDSGPLRLARTPSPPEDETPPESPDASSNHMLRPVSPGPPRPKSPIQFKKGPPVPPPPKVTPTKEVAEEQIIDLFGGEFLPAPSPSQPNERPGESLLDMDFDAFQPDESVSPIPQDAAAPSFFTDFDKMNESETTEEGPAASLKQTDNELKEATAPPAGEQCASPSLLADDEFEQQPLESKVEEAPAPPAGKAQEHEAPIDDEEDDKPSENQQEEEPATKAGSPEKPEPAEVPLTETKSSGGEAAPSEKMPIPSVVIEPASSNEGDDDRDADIISPTAVGDDKATPQSRGLKHMSPSGGGSGFPDDFLYKVETMHDFEAANSDELELKRGDVVLVVPTASMEDQEAGWLTGIKESDWSTLGVGAQRGLFPENFTQRLN